MARMSALSIWRASHRLRLFLPWAAFVTVCLSAPAQSPVADTSPGGNSASPSPQTLPDGAGELNELKLQNDRRLAETDASLLAWRTVVGNLTAARTTVAGLTSPDTTVLEKMVSSPVTSANEAAVRSQEQLAAGALQGLLSRASPNAIGNGFANNSPVDPDVTVFMAEWQNKVSSIEATVNFQAWFPILYGTTSMSPSQVASVLPDIAKKASADAFNQDKAALLSALDSLLQEATAARDKADKNETSGQALEDAIVAKQSKTKTEINQLAIELGLPLFCATVLLMLSIPIVVQAVRNSTSDEIHAIFSSGILVEIITVLLLTMSILILGLSGKLDGPVLGTLLGGISGYVLNRFRGKNQNAPAGPDASPAGEQPDSSGL